MPSSLRMIEHANCGDPIARAPQRAIGSAASSRFPKVRFGIWTAYGIVGGAIAGRSTVALIAGRINLKANLSAMPPAHACTVVAACGGCDRPAAILDGRASKCPAS